MVDTLFSDPSELISQSILASWSILLPITVSILGFLALPTPYHNQVWPPGLSYSILQSSLAP